MFPREREILTTVLFANTVLLWDPGRLSVCLSVVHLRQRGRCWLDSVCQHAAVRHSKPLCDALVCFLSSLSPGHPAPTVRSPYPRCPTPWEPLSVGCCSPSAVADTSNTLYTYSMQWTRRLTKSHRLLVSDEIAHSTLFIQLLNSMFTNWQTLHS